MFMQVLFRFGFSNLLLFWTPCQDSNKLISEIVSYFENIKTFFFFLKILDEVHFFLLVRVFGYW